MKMSVRPAAETREQTHGTEVGRRSVKHRRTSCRASIHHLEQARLNRGDSHPSLQSTALIRYLGEPITVIGVGRKGNDFGRGGLAQCRGQVDKVRVGV
jgi:hypothetical protein